MTLYNTTFTIHNSVLDKCLFIIQSEIIEKMLEDGFTQPFLMKVISIQDPEYSNYALQFQAPDMEFINNWKNNNMGCMKILQTIFKEKVLYFDTILESI